jgi:hypothetical protein
MKKTLIAVAAASTLAVASLATPQSAQADCWGCAVGAGVIGGLALGAIIGSAAHPYYGPGYYYGPGPVYYGPGPVYYRPDCYWVHRRWWDGWRWRWGRVRVCR